MNTDSKFLYDKQLIKNNSSFLTAENSSTIQSNIKTPVNNIYRNKSIKNLNDIQFLNSTIFTHPHKNKHKNKSLWFKTSSVTSQNNSNNNVQLYLTETKDTISTRYNSRNKKKYLNLYKNIKTKNSLPLLPIFNYQEKIKYPDIFTCGDFSMKPKILTKLYYRQNKSKDNIHAVSSDSKELRKNDDDIHKNILKETTREYVSKTKQINLLNYYIQLKKESLEKYKNNMNTQMKGIFHTIYQINNYKSNLEKNYLIKYNEEKKEFEQEIKRGLLKQDILKKQLLSLLKEVGALSQIIIKKQSIKKRYEKWLLFQIQLKEGIEPKITNIKKYLENNYGQKPIFENYDDFFMAFREKEVNNLRLLQRKEKLILELKKIQEEYNELNENLVKIDIENNEIMWEKEQKLILLKERNADLNVVRNNIVKKEKKIKYSKSLKNYKTKYNIIKEEERDIDAEKDIKLNPLGVYYYNLDKVKDIHKIIHCIYNCILKNKIKGLNITYDSIFKVNNSITNNKKSLLRIQIIEYSINYIQSSIKEKMKIDKNKQIIKEAEEQNELYHKMIKAKTHEENKMKKIKDFIQKMREKSRKVYFLPHKKVNLYPFGLYPKKKPVSINNNKNKFELFDFLYDNSFD